MSAPRTQKGRVTSMTLFTELRSGAAPYLRVLFWLAARLPLPSLTLLRLRGIHFGRWALLTHLPPGGPRRSRRRLRRPFLFFESNYDGQFGRYIDAFAYAFPRGMWLIWGSSFEYPGAIPVRYFKEWIEKRELPCAHYYVANPDHTTRSIQSALHVRERLQAFARNSPRLEPDEFRPEFDRLLADVQGDL